MFQKTLAAFDEGGTSGLLLNHLRCFEDICELVLDCSTVVSATADGNVSTLTQGDSINSLADVQELNGKTLGPHFL